MSQWNMFIWEFDEPVLNMFEAIMEAGYFENVAQEIINHTYLHTVFVDEVRGFRSDYEYNEDKFDDDVLVAIRIIDNAYQDLILQKED